MDDLEEKQQREHQEREEQARQQKERPKRRGDTDGYRSIG
jgi:flagellar biosynthesis/type III secretory pathway protein FliH